MTSKCEFPLLQVPIVSEIQRRLQNATCSCKCRGQGVCACDHKDKPGVCAKCNDALFSSHTDNRVKVKVGTPPGGPQKESADGAASPIAPTLKRASILPQSHGGNSRRPPWTRGNSKTFAKTMGYILTNFFTPAEVAALGFPKVQSGMHECRKYTQQQLSAGPYAHRITTHMCCLWMRRPDPSSAGAYVHATGEDFILVWNAIYGKLSRQIGRAHV